MKPKNEFWRDEWIDYAESFLAQNPYIPMWFFEAEMLQHFDTHFAPNDYFETLKGKPKGRTKAQNLVDWIKAGLTKRGVTESFYTLKDRWIVYGKTAAERQLVKNAVKAVKTHIFKPHLEAIRKACDDE